MSKKTKISKIVLEVGGKKIEMSLSEARELKQILNDTFPDKETVFIPSTPVIIKRQWPYWRPYETWCGNTSGDSYYLSSDQSQITSGSSGR